MPLLLESSDEEEEEEETEEVAPALTNLDASQEFTAERFLAKSASKTYLQKLQQTCLEAVDSPELQEKQRQALAEHAARHPEMQPPRPTPTSGQGSRSPMQAETSPSGPLAPGLEDASNNSPSPKPKESPGVSALPSPETSPKKSEHSRTSSPRRAKAGSPKRSAPKPSPKPSPSPKSPSSPAKRPGSRQRKARPQPSPSASAPPAAPPQPSAPPSKKPAVQTLGATSSTIEPSPKAGASMTYLDETALSMEMQLQANGTASLTQLPSSTWRGHSRGEEHEMFLTHLSKHQSMPLITFLPRRSGDLWPTNSNPAPGTYPPKDEARTSKYQAPRQVSFGFGRRFSRWPQNADKKPGPGAHSVANFERFKYAEPTGRSFSRAPRGRPNPVRQTGPGPGAYGTKFGSTEEGPSVTMVGKFRKRGVLNYDEPGPGAYDPSTVLCQPAAAAVGFATALREDFYPKEDKQKPAPGAYHDGFLNNPIGSDCLAFSITGKRRKHDLTRHLYAEPGPGFYKHAHSFGYSTTWVKPQAQNQQPNPTASAL